MAAFVGRREFVTLLGGAAAVWPIAVCAQQPRRVGVLIASHSQTDREGQASIAAFLDTFQRLGWTDGRNVRIEYRWGAGDLRAAKAVAPSLGVAVTAIDVLNDGGMERSVAAFAGQPDGGLVVLPHRHTVAKRRSIIILAARHRLPAIYPFPVFAAEGGLISYGFDPVDSWRGAATYPGHR